MIETENLCYYPHYVVLSLSLCFCVYMYILVYTCMWMSWCGVLFWNVLCYNWLCDGCGQMNKERRPSKSFVGTLPKKMQKLKSWNKRTKHCSIKWLFWKVRNEEGERLNLTASYYLHLLSFVSTVLLSVSISAHSECALIRAQHYSVMCNLMPFQLTWKWPRLTLRRPSKIWRIP